MGRANASQAFNGVDGQAWRGRHACFSAIPLSARGEGGVSSRIDTVNPHGSLRRRRMSGIVREPQGCCKTLPARPAILHQAPARSRPHKAAYSPASMRGRMRQLEMSSGRAHTVPAQPLWRHGTRMVTWWGGRRQAPAAKPVKTNLTAMPCSDLRGDASSRRPWLPTRRGAPGTRRCRRFRGTRSKPAAARGCGRSA